jgi:hypothetical protein
MAVAALAAVPLHAQAAKLLPSAPAHAVPQAYAYGFVPGDRVPDLAVTDSAGRRTTLHGLAGAKGTVLITRDVECPVSQRYLPRMIELAQRYRAQGFSFAILDVTPHSPAEARRAAAQAAPLRSVIDDGKAISTALRAESTAEAFVIDARGTLRYRGAIDDQYGLSHQRAEVRSPWLVDALEKVVRGEDPHTKRTRADGCPLASAKATDGIAIPVTYHNRISRIIQANCQVCHRKGGLAPMPLENYRQVHERRAVIDAMVSSGRMPPWSAHRSVGEWANDRSLAERDKRDLLEWLRNGAVEGNPAEAPVPRRFATGWNIGKPDATVAIPKPLRVPAQGVVAYQYVYAKTNFGEDKWVAAVEIKPTQPRVVHHVIAFIEEPGRRFLTAAERGKLRPGDPVPPEPNDSALGFFAVTVPGSLGIVYPEGTGKKLPKGAWIRFEIHYQPNGTEVMDRTEIGFRFAPRPLREVESLSAPNTGLVIPPHAPRHEVKATYTFRQPGQLLSLFPHMHLRGTAFRYDLQMPDGKLVPLLDVPKFDFNWQSHYEFRVPHDVPAGATLHATAWYDNSKGNPWNPDPSATVRWGPQTYEEMMIGYFDFVARDGARDQSSPLKAPGAPAPTTR